MKKRQARSENAEFRHGASATQKATAAYNSKIPKRFVPSSKDHQWIRSGNGMSEKDAARRLYGTENLLPTQNGMSEASYKALRAKLSTKMNAKGKGKS